MSAKAKVVSGLLLVAIILGALTTWLVSKSYGPNPPLLNLVAGTYIYAWLYLFFLFPAIPFGVAYFTDRP